MGNANRKKKENCSGYSKMTGKAGAEAMSVSGGVLGVNRTVASEGVPKEGSPLCSKEAPSLGAGGKDKRPPSEGEKPILWTAWEAFP